MSLLDRIRSWFKPKAVVPQSRPSPLPIVEHKLASLKIVAGQVQITNYSENTVILTGGPLKQIVIHPHESRWVKSPILEPVWRFNSLTKTREIAFVNEWDALEVIDNMITEYARGRAYDLMSLQELRECTLPLPKRAMAELIEKVGVKAQRDNENISAQAR